MKPMLIIPPAPARWPAIRELLAHEGSPWIEDLEARLKTGVAGARDAVVIVPNGAQVLATAYVCVAGDIGVLRHVFTREDHRKRGFARAVIETLTSWFPMVGGRRLYVPTTREGIEFLAKFGFYESHIAAGEKVSGAMMRRMWPDASEDPMEYDRAAITVRALTRVDWPRMVALLQHQPGAIPNTPMEESAVAAPANTLELLNQQDRRMCALLGGFVGDALVGFASVATEQLGERTYAMMTPFDAADSPLRDAAVALGKERGYGRVDFPLEAMAAIV